MEGVCHTISVVHLSMSLESFYNIFLRAYGGRGGGGGGAPPRCFFVGVGGGGGGGIPHLIDFIDVVSQIAI